MSWEQVTELCVLRVSYSACLGASYRGVCLEGELLCMSWEQVTEVCVLRVSYSACLGSKLQSCVS